MTVTSDPLRDLARLGDDALGPCAFCQRVMLGTEVPIFYRITIQHCGIDRKAVRQRVGLAQFFGGGQNGLVLSGVMGSHDKPVVEIGRATINVCLTCAQEHPDVLLIVAAAIEPKEGGR